MSIIAIVAVVGVGLVALLVLALVYGLLKGTFVYIEANQIGLVTKNFGKPLPDGQIIAFHGEAGYQKDILQPGWRFLVPFLYSVRKFTIPQVAFNSVGVVVAQIGKDMPVGAMVATGLDKNGKEMTSDIFNDPEAFLEAGGEKGVQSITLAPGSTWSTINPAAFLIKTTSSEVWGLQMTDSAVRALEGLDTKVVNVGGKKEIDYEQAASGRR